MSDRVFYCPDCRNPFPDSRLPPQGELFDCPRCHLLFIPADKDFAGGVGLREYESQWSDEGMGRKPKSPFSERVRRRVRRITIMDLVIVWLTGMAMMGIAWIIFVIAHTAHERMELSPPIAREKTPGSPAPVADAPGSPAAVADAPGALKTMPTESLSRLSEPGLIGDWESADSPLEGVTSGEMFALTLGPKGAAKLHSRNSLEIENVTGQWRVAGSKLILRFSEGGSVRSVEMAAELADADRLRLTVGGKTAEFQRKKN